MGRVTSKAVGTAVIAASALCCTGAAAAVAVEAGSPVTVEDLHVVAVSADSVTLEWTQVDDGTGDPADYALRYGSPSLAWGGAYDTEETTPGTAVGEPSTHTFSGLSDGTEYEFALVSYRGTLNVDAEFGGISNTASAHTGSGGEASVTVSPATVYLRNVGDTVKLTMTATETDGSVVQSPDASWTSTDTGVGTVDGNGVVTATGSGTTMIVGAAACCGSDTTSVTVGGAGDALHPNEPADMTVLAAADGSVAESNDHAFGIASFGNWWGYNGGGSHNVYTVEDAGNPTGSGSAVRLDWQSEYNEAAIANIDFEGGPWKQLYIMHRVVNAPCWDGSGHKWFYMVPSGEGRWGRGIWSSIESGGALRVIDGVNGVAVGSGSGTLHVWPPDEIAMEYLFVAESSPGAGDGQVYVWVNGKLVGSASDVVMADSDTYSADWDRLHYYGKANDAPDCHFDVRELYISGK